MSQSSARSKEAPDEKKALEKGEDKQCPHSSLQSDLQPSPDSFSQDLSDLKTPPAVGLFSPILDEELKDTALVTPEGRSWLMHSLEYVAFTPLPKLITGLISLLLKNKSCSQSTDVASPEESAQTSETSANTAGIGRSLSTACSWIWRASPAACITLGVTSAVTSLLSYKILDTGRAVTNHLQALAAGKPEVLDSLYLVALEGGAFALLLATTAIAYNGTKSFFSTRLSQTVRSESLKAINKFTPAEHQDPTIVSECNMVLRGRFAMESFGTAVFETIAATAGVVSSVFALSQSASLLPVAIVTSFVPVYLLHAVHQGREKLAAMRQTNNAHGRFNYLDWNSGGAPPALEIKVHGKSEDLRVFLKQEKVKIDTVDRKPEIAQLRREAWLQPFNSLTLTALGMIELTKLAHLLIVSEVNSVDIGGYGMTIGALLAANSSFTALSSGFSALIKEFPTIRSVQAVIDKTADKDDGVEQNGSNGSQFAMAPEVIIKNLSYAYPTAGGKPAETVLHDVSLTIAPGELISIVGSSGCGKTTLMKLLCRVLAAPPRTVLIDDKPIEELTPKEASNTFGYSQQESVVIFATTLRDNVLIGARREMSDDEIMEHLTASGFAEDMRKKNWSLDNLVGSWFEGGIGLSGGQATRLALARLYATGAKLIALDEPTSNLDQDRTDKVLHRLLSQSTYTRIVIAHDYGVARKAGRVVVMKEGRIEDIGTHEELLVRCATYRDGFRAQAIRLVGELTDTEVEVIRGRTSTI
jgi:ATP-binding cassette subfamily B protein